MQSTYLRENKDACSEQMVKTTEKSEVRERSCMKEGEEDHKTGSFEGPELVL